MFPFRIRINPNLSRSLATMLEGIQKYLILGSGTSNTKAGASHNSKQLLIMLENPHKCRSTAVCLKVRVLRPLMAVVIVLRSQTVSHHGSDYRRLIT